MIPDILVPIDFSKYSIFALKIAKEKARKSGGTIHLLHVVEPQVDNQQFYEGTYSPAELREKTLIAKEKIRDLATSVNDVDLKTEVVTGEVYYKIIEFGENHSIDLIIMGYFGESGSRTLKPGMNTELVSLGAKSPVITTKDGVLNNKNVELLETSFFDSINELL